MNIDSKQKNFEDILRDKYDYSKVATGLENRIEFASLNKSLLFSGEFRDNLDLFSAQKSSYDKFLNEGIKKIFNNYFPKYSSAGDYNNTVTLYINNIQLKDPKEISRRLAKLAFATWSYMLYVNIIIKWNCNNTKQIEIIGTVKESIYAWFNASFNHKENSNVEILITEISENNWVIEEIIKVNKNNRFFRMNLKINSFNEKNNRINASFECELRQKIFFCRFPKMDLQGQFIINGNTRVPIFQSFRAPGIYFFSKDNAENLIEENKGESRYFLEMIPEKGVWLKMEFQDGSLKIKFLTKKKSEQTTNCFHSIKSSGYELSLENIKAIFGDNPEIINDYNLSGTFPETKRRIFPLSSEESAYFSLGDLGRDRLNKKINSSILKGLRLSESIKDKEGNVILDSGTIVNDKEIEIINNYIREDKIKALNDLYSADNSTEDNSFYSVNVIYNNKPFVVLFVDGKSKKSNFGLSDFLCLISYLYNLKNGLNLPFSEEKHKDFLNNQNIKGIGEILYNILDNRISNFLTGGDFNKYIGSISKMSKANILSINGLKEINAYLGSFYNISPTIQQASDINPNSLLSMSKKVSLNMGGFSSANAGTSVRRDNDSYDGRYGLDTPEGHSVGLVRHMTISSDIRDGQIIRPFFKVKMGKILNEVCWLSYDEEFPVYTTHCAIKVNSQNQIEETRLKAKYKGNIVEVPVEYIQYIQRSFYDINSISSNMVTLLANNDPVRICTVSGMMKHVVIPYKGAQAPIIASGVESLIANNAFLNIRSKASGTIDYVDSRCIIVKDKDGKKISHSLLENHLPITNNGSVFWNIPRVKTGDKVSENQIISFGNYCRNDQYANGPNLTTAVMSFEGFNFEDSMALNQRIFREGLLDSLHMTVHTIVRKNEKFSEEVFTKEHLSVNKTTNLDDEGIIKVGSRVKGDDILVGKITPEIPLEKGLSEEDLLMNVYNERFQSFKDSSLFLPWHEKGVVSSIERIGGEEFRKIVRESKGYYSANSIEIVRVTIISTAKIQVGDKLTTEFGNKGVIAKIFDDCDMPFDEYGRTVDIIINPLGIPSRLNIGQLLEGLLGKIFSESNMKALVKPFNTPSIDLIESLSKDLNLNYGQVKLFDGKTGKAFANKVSVFVMHILKLKHLASSKDRARSSNGKYSWVNQQPVKGRSNKGGGALRVGEMEFRYLTVHGAVNFALELYGVRSDDIQARRRLAGMIMRDIPIKIDSCWSESTNMIVQYLRVLGFDVKAFTANGDLVNWYDSYYNGSLKTFKRRKKDK